MTMPRSRHSAPRWASDTSAVETLDLVVRLVDLHRRHGARADGVGVVAQVGAVGGADLDHAAAGARHDVGHAEGAADLDELAARHQHLLLRRQRRQHQQHGGGVVVDDRRRLGAGQLADEVLDVVVALATLAGGDVVLEVGGLAEHAGDRSRRLWRQQRAAEIGVQHRAGEVEDGAQRGCEQPLEAGGGGGDQRRLVRYVATVGKHGAHRGEAAA